MRIDEATPQLEQLNEMLVKNENHLSTDVENSIYYARIKQLLHGEIMRFCKEQTELKSDLNFFRMNVGEIMSESEIRDYLDQLKVKYQTMENVGLEYHIEATRIDFGVPVVCVIKRGSDILMKKFVFRFRRRSQFENVGNLTNAQIISNSLKRENEKKNKEKLGIADILTE